jgi:hypothetical protein
MVRVEGPPASLPSPATTPLSTGPIQAASTVVLPTPDSFTYPQMRLDERGGEPQHIVVLVVS